MPNRENFPHLRGEKKPYGGMTEAEIESLVARVAAQVMDDFYQNVGRNVMTRVYQAVGLIFVAGMLWVAGVKIKTMMPP